MRIYSQLLSMAMDSHNDKLFTFYYDMPEEYKPIFEHKFLLRFGYRNINFDSYQMFKRMLESKLLELMPKYLRLYESEKVPFNPFVNVNIENNNFSREKGRAKSYATNNNKSRFDNSDASSRSSVDRRATSGGSSSSSFESHRTDDKHSAVKDTGNSKLNLFSDTPQTPIQSQGGGGGDVSYSDSEAGATTTEGEGSKYFNDGFITTASKDKESYQEISSNVDRTWGNNASESGTDSYTSEGGFTNDINQGKQAGVAVGYSDNEAVNANQRTQVAEGKTEGLSGVLTSHAVIEWRKTFINIDAMLLDELEPLFMGIY